MKAFLKKYGLLVGLVVSFVIIVASLFVAGFCGIKLGTSLGGGSQFEITIPNDANTTTYAENIKGILRGNGLSADSFAVEDKFIEDGTEFGYTKRAMIVKIHGSNISDEKEQAVRQEIATKLNINISNISEIDNIVSSIKSKDILLLGLGIGLIAICLFVFAWIRYDVFAGLSFILAYLNNLIVYLAIIIITRMPLSLVAIAAIILLTIVMSSLMISIYEKNKVESEMSLKEKQTPSSRLASCKKYAVKPYIFVAIATVLFALGLFCVTISNAVFNGVCIILALLVSAYTGLVVGPGVYGYFIDLKEANLRATLSRNENVNKEIKKKIKRASANKK